MRGVMALCLALSLGGCSALKGATGEDCGGVDAKNVTLSIVRDAIADQAAQSSQEAGVSISKSKVRAAVKQLALSLEDIRTTKEDPNSTKRFCTGTVKLVAPAEMIQDAERARELAGASTLTDLADNSNVEVNANAYSADIDFNVQPTDDGEKIFAEIENGDGAFGFFAELVRDHLLKSQVEEARAAQDRLAAEQAAAEQSALAEQQAATLEEAKAENKIAIQTINAVWAGIPGDTRRQLLELQKAWGRKKDAECRVEAASSSTDEKELAISRLRCDTRMQSERAGWLRNYMDSSSYEEAEVAAGM